MIAIQLGQVDVRVIEELLKRKHQIDSLGRIRSERIHRNDGSDAASEKYWSDDDQGDYVTVLGTGRVNVIYRGETFWGLQIDAREPECLQEDFEALKEQFAAPALGEGGL